MFACVKLIGLATIGEDRMKKALVLSKETLRTLDEQDLSLVAGGGGHHGRDDHYGHDYRCLLYTSPSPRDRS